MKLSDIILGRVYSNIVHIATLLSFMAFGVKPYFSHGNYSSDELLVMEIVVPVVCVIVNAFSVLMLRKYMKQGEEPYENVDRTLYFSLGLSIFMLVVGGLNYVGII